MVGVDVIVKLSLNHGPMGHEFELDPTLIRLIDENHYNWNLQLTWVHMVYEVDP